MFSRHDLDKKVSIVFTGGGVHAVKGTLTDYDPDWTWIEVRGVIASIERGSGIPSRHVIPANGIAYVRFDNEEEKP
jgi:hypothetical protein